MSQEASPPSPTGMAPSLSVVIPAYNEERRIAPSLVRVHEFLRARGYDGEILVVDDGSRDRTVEVVRELARSLPLLRLITYAPNRGPGAAVRTGILAAAREAILYTDADLSTPIEDVDLLWPSYDRGFDIVMGSRHLRESRVEILQPPHRRIMGRVFKAIVALLCVRGFRDTQCGFKLFRAGPAKRIFSRVRSRGFTFNVEALIYARALGMRIAEVAVRWKDVEGTRIGALRESFRTMAEILRIRGLLPRRRA